MTLRESPSGDQSESETLEGHWGLPVPALGLFLSSVGHESTNSRRAGGDFDPETASQLASQPVIHPAATGKSLCVSESTCICRSQPAASSQHASVAQCKCETRNKFYDVFDGCHSVRVSRCPNVSLSYWLPDLESEKRNPDPALELFPFPFPGPALTSAVAWDQTLREIAAYFILPSILRPGWLPSRPALLPARAVSNANKTFAPAIKAQDDDSFPSSFPSCCSFGKKLKEKNERKEYDEWRHVAAGLYWWLSKFWLT